LKSCSRLAISKRVPPCAGTHPRPLDRISNSRSTNHHWRKRISCSEKTGKKRPMAVSAMNRMIDVVWRNAAGPTTFFGFRSSKSDDSTSSWLKISSENSLSMLFHHCAVLLQGPRNSYVCVFLWK
jgi:hypothetical protein